ncbi:MAG: diguanylate cyclase [Aquificaceae bacterium]
MDYSSFDLIQYPVLVVDKECKIIFANKRAREVYNLQANYVYENSLCPVKIMQDTCLERGHKTKMDIHEIMTRPFFEGPVVFFQWKRAEGWPVEFVSPNVVDLLGYTAEDFTSGRISYAELIHPEDLPRVTEEVEYHTENRSASWTHQDYRLRRRDGSYVWVIDHTVPLLEGEEVVGYVGYVFDITERHEKEELFHLLADMSPYGVLIYDFDQNKILYGNRTLEKLFGYSLKELLEAQNPLSFVHPKDRKKVIENVIKRRQGYRKAIKYRLRIVEKCGNIKHAELFSIVIQYKGRDVSFITLKDITEEVEREKEYIRLATTDPLTGIYNRRMLFENLMRFIQEAERYKETFSLLLFDIDNFKLVNDTYGHLIGDMVLENLANCVKSIIRKSDIFGRYGGEEFLLILPKTKRPFDVGEKIRSFVEGLRLENGLKITVSIGGTVYKEGDTADSIIQRADKALYRAKRLGKNRVVVL